MGIFRTVSFSFPRLSTFTSRPFLSLGLPCSTISENSDATRKAGVGELDTIDDARDVLDDILHRKPLPSLYGFNLLHSSSVISSSQELQVSGISHHELHSLLDCFSRPQLLWKDNIIGERNEARNFENEMTAKGVSSNGIANISLCNAARKAFKPVGDKSLAPPKLVNRSTLLTGYCKLGMMPISNAQNLQLGHTQKLRLYHSGSDSDSRKQRGKLIRLSENRNLQDQKRRALAAKYELRRKLYKAFCKDPDLPAEVREKHRYKLSKLPRKSSFTRVRNRCIFTGRPRAVYESFRVSRLVFRELASRGALMGIKKSSW